jgi:hypothetical protein
MSLIANYQVIENVHVEEFAGCHQVPGHPL